VAKRYTRYTLAGGWGTQPHDGMGYQEGRSAQMGHGMRKGCAQTQLTLASTVVRAQIQLTSTGAQMAQGIHKGCAQIQLTSTVGVPRLS
jgi:hypothetical protein